MQEFKGTPGPWFIKPVPNCTVEGAVNVIQTHNNNGLGFHIAYASGWIDDKEEKDEADANARILAAAPELLEALQLLMAEQSGGNKSCGHSGFTCTCPYDKAKATISKALGQ